VCPRKIEFGGFELRVPTDVIFVRNAMCKYLEGIAACPSSISLLQIDFGLINFHSEIY
jgi:hypothetical protein